MVIRGHCRTNNPSGMSRVPLAVGLNLGMAASGSAICRARFLHGYVVAPPKALRSRPQQSDLEVHQLRKLSDRVTTAELANRLRETRPPPPPIAIPLSPNPCQFL